MSTTHSRSASALDRRSIHANGLPSRVNTVVSRYERPSVGANGFSGFADSITSMVKDVPDLSSRRREERRTIEKETFIIRRDLARDTIDRRRRSQSPSDRRRSIRGPQAGSKSWQPEVKLVRGSGGPLATQVTPPSLSRNAPENLAGPSLADMTLYEQESTLFQDLLFVLLGFEGQYVTFVDGYDPAEEKDRLVGPRWKVSHGLDLSLKNLVQSMLTMASHYIALETFVEVQSRQEYGLVNHALCAAMRRLLKDYLILVTQLESRMADESSSSSAPGFTLQQMRLALMPTAQSMAQVYAVAQDLLKKNSLLQEDVEESLNDFDADNIIERLKEGGDFLPGSMSKKKCIGGNVLTLLTQRLATYSGDPASKKVLEMLLREASKPYMSMLNEWLHRGGIRDPHDEFLIGERQSIKRERLDEDYTDEYWEKRYYIREKEVPPQLVSMKERILLAGKYLNVVRECGGVNIIGNTPHTPIAFDDVHFLDNINHAYSVANRELLSLMLAKSSLRNRLRSVKHYFFLDRAEFFLYFLELSSSELAKPRRSVNIGKLQSLLDIVLHQPGSIATSDPYKDDVSVKLNDLGLVPWLMKIVNVQGLDTDDPAQMEAYRVPASTTGSSADEKDIHGYEALELDYSVPFPLSLIISRKTITRYQLILRYTLSLRHLEQTLLDSWSEHNKALSWLSHSHTRRIEIWKRRAWTLRARMLVFVQQMLFYATAEVLEPQFQKLMTKVDILERADLSTASSKHLISELGTFDESQTVDSLIQSHLDMLDTSLKDLGLTQSKLLRIHAKMVAGCTMFASYTSNLTRNLYSADPSLSWITEPPPSELTGTEKQKFEQRRDRVHRNFAVFSHGRNSEIPAYDAARLSKIEETLGKHEDYFNRHLKVLIDTLNYYAATETVTLLGLCGRLMGAEVQKRDDPALL